MSASETRVPPVAKSALRAKAATHNAKARPSTRVNVPILATVYTRGIEQARTGGPKLRERQALKRVDEYLNALSNNRQCKDADLYPKRTSLTASIADATHLARELNAIEVRTLIATAALYDDADPRRSFNLNRALAQSARDPQLYPLTDALTVLVADGNSTWARRMRAMRQLRDRFGKWIRMGGGIRFKVDMPGVGPGYQWYHGVANGMDIPNGLVNVKLEDGRQVKIPAAKVEKIKATLPDAQRSRRQQIARKYESKSDADLQKQWDGLNSRYSRLSPEQRNEAGAQSVKAQMNEIKEAISGRNQTGEADDPDNPAPVLARLDLKHVTPSKEDMATEPVDAAEFKGARDDVTASLKKLVPDDSPNASRRDALVSRLAESDDEASLARLADDAAALHQQLLDSDPKEAEAFRGFSEDVDGLASLRDSVKGTIPAEAPAEQKRDRPPGPLLPEGFTEIDVPEGMPSDVVRAVETPAGDTIVMNGRNEWAEIGSLDAVYRGPQIAADAMDARRRAPGADKVVRDVSGNRLYPGDAVDVENWRDGRVVPLRLHYWGADEDGRALISNATNDDARVMRRGTLRKVNRPNAFPPDEWLDKQEKVTPEAVEESAVDALPDGWEEVPLSPAAALNFSRIVKSDDGIQVGLNKNNGKWFDPRNPWSSYDTPEEAVQARRDADAERLARIDADAPAADEVARLRREANQDAERQRRQDALPEPVAPLTQEEALKLADQAGFGQDVKDAIATGDREKIAAALRKDNSRGDRFLDWETRGDVELPRQAQKDRWERDGKIFEPLLNVQPADDTAAELPADDIEDFDTAQSGAVGRLTARKLAGERVHTQAEDDRELDADEQRASAHYFGAMHRKLAIDDNGGRAKSFDAANNSLRDGSLARGLENGEQWTTPVKSIVDGLDSAVDRSSLVEPARVFRGIVFSDKSSFDAFMEQAQESGVISDPAFMSTTVDKAWARGFLGNAESNSVIWAIDLPAGTHVARGGKASADGLSFDESNNPEGEFLLGRDSALRVRSIEPQDDGSTLIRADYAGVMQDGNVTEYARHEPVGTPVENLDISTAPGPDDIELPNFGARAVLPDGYTEMRVSPVDNASFSRMVKSDDGIQVGLNKHNDKWFDPRYPWQGFNTPEEAVQSRRDRDADAERRRQRRQVQDDAVRENLPGPISQGDEAEPAPDDASGVGRLLAKYKDDDTIRGYTVAADDVDADEFMAKLREMGFDPQVNFTEDGTTAIDIQGKVTDLWQAVEASQEFNEVERDQPTDPVDFEESLWDADTGDVQQPSEAVGPLGVPGVDYEPIGERQIMALPLPEKDSAREALYDDLAELADLRDSDGNTDLEPAIQDFYDILAGNTTPEKIWEWLDKYQDALPVRTISRIDGNRLRLADEIAGVDAGTDADAPTPDADLPVDDQQGRINDLIEEENRNAARAWADAERAEAPSPGINFEEWGNNYAAAADNLSEIARELRGGRQATYGTELGSYARVLKSYGDKLKDPDTSQDELDATYGKIEAIGNRIDKLLIGENGDYNIPETIANAIDAQWIDIENLVNERRGLDLEPDDFDMGDIPLSEPEATPDAPEADAPEAPAMNEPEGPFDRVDAVPAEFNPQDDHRWLLPDGSWVDYDSTDGSLTHYDPETGEGRPYNPDELPVAPEANVPAAPAGDEQRRLDIQERINEATPAAFIDPEVNDAVRAAQEALDAGDLDRAEIAADQAVAAAGRDAPEANAPAAPGLPEIVDPKNDLYDFVQAVRGMPEYGEYQEREGNQLDRLLTGLVRDLNDRPTSFWNDRGFGSDTPAIVMASDLRVWDHKPEVKQIIDALRAGVADGPIEAREPDVTGQPEGVDAPAAPDTALERFDRLSAGLQNLANDLADDGYDVADLQYALDHEDPAGAIEALTNIPDVRDTDARSAIYAMIRRLEGKPAAPDAPDVNDDRVDLQRVDNNVALAIDALVGDNGVVDWDTQDVMDMFPQWEYEELMRVMTILERANLVRELTDDDIRDRVNNGGDIRGERAWENLGVDGNISDADIVRMAHEELARSQPPAEQPAADIDTPELIQAEPRPAATPPQPAGAAPGEINQYVSNGVVNDRFGRSLYKGVRVRGADGVEGTVVRVQQEPAYARIKLDDGRVLVRSGRRLVRIDQPADSTPDGGAPAAPNAPEPDAPPAPDVPAAVMPGDYAEPYLPGVAREDRSGATPGVSEPRDVDESSVNPSAKQIDYAQWHGRDAEIAAAASRRPSNSEIWEAGANDQSRILGRIFGVGEEFSFGDNKYTLKERSHSVWNRLGGDKTASMSLNIMDGDTVVGEISRSIYFDKNTGKYTAANKLMKLNRGARGGGFAAAYNRWMENWYIANDFDAVYVEAAGGGSWTGGYVWAVNGFDWDLREHGAGRRDQLNGGAEFVQRLLRIAERSAPGPDAKAQIDHLKTRTQAVRDGDRDATLPTPLDLALIGWRPGKRTWAGKDLMSNQSWDGVKRLVPDDYAYRQNSAYSGIKAAEGRVKNKVNAVKSPELGRVIADPANVKSMGGSDRLQKWSRQIGDVLSDGDSLAALPPLVKRDLKTMVNVVLAYWKRSEREGWSYGGMELDLDKLNIALDAESRLDFPARSSLPESGDALRDVTLNDLERAGRAAGANQGKLADYSVYKLTGEGGVNATFKVTHNPSGQIYFLKWDKIASQWQGQDPIHGANAERDPNKYLAAMGYNGIPGFERSRVEDAMIVMQRVGDNLDLAERPKDAVNVLQRPQSARDYVDYRDPIRVQMLDGLFGNGDRHDKNYQYAQRASDGKWYIIPIDNAFNAIARNGDNLSLDAGGRHSIARRITGVYSRAYSQYLRDLQRSLGESRFNQMMVDLVQEAIDANNAARPNYATSSLGDYIDAQLQLLSAEVADGSFAAVI